MKIRKIRIILLILAFIGLILGFAKLIETTLISSIIIMAVFIFVLILGRWDKTDKEVN